MDRHRKPMSTGSRDLLSHGAGKGDKPRYKHNQNWLDNYARINWDIIDPMMGQRTKKYKLA